MVTEARIKQALDNWLFRCITTSGGQEGQTYWGEVSYKGRPRLMKVIVSMDDDTIANAYLDRKATRAWQRNSRGYFQQHCRDGSFEERQ